MRFLCRLQFILIAAIWFTPKVLLATNDDRLNLYDVSHYDLSISFDFPNKSFSGSVAVKASALRPIHEFVLSASNETLTIDSVVSNGEKLNYEHNKDHLVIEIHSTLQPQAAISLTVYYRGISRFAGQYEGGGVFFTSIKGVDCLATASEPMFARTWWPCKDLPSDKATASITITVPRKLTAVSNGLLKKVDHHDASATFYWETTYPIATYLVSIAAADYKEFSDTYHGLDGKEMDIRYYVYPADYEHAKIDFQNTTKILSFFASTFCEYPFIDEKFGYAEVPGDLTMENQTLCSVEDKLITGKRESELTLVHETSHHWWGNLITPMGWNHTWLNEGFATYAEALYLEHTGGRDAYNNYIGRVMAIKPGQLAGSIIGQTDTLFWDSFSSRVYFKGALVLHMLRSMIGDSEFFSVMRNYLNNPRLRYGNARTEDFIAECEHVHMQSLKWFFDQWVYTKTDSIDRPEIEYQWTSEPEATSYKVTLNLTQKNASTIVYRLPLSIDIKSEATSSSFPVVDSLASQSFTFTVSGKPVSVEIDKEHKIFKTLTLKN